MTEGMLEHVTILPIKKYPVDGDGKQEKELESFGSWSWVENWSYFNQNEILRN
jgi:hypothetical protein